MKRFSYQTPERKIGEIFHYNGSMYQVMPTDGLPLASPLGCLTKDPVTGNYTDLCAFSRYCGRVNMVHRGYCTSTERKDGKAVYFKKLSV